MPLSIRSKTSSPPAQQANHTTDQANHTTDLLSNTLKNQLTRLSNLGYHSLTIEFDSVNDNRVDYFRKSITRFAGTIEDNETTIETTFVISKLKAILNTTNSQFSLCDGELLNIISDWANLYQRLQQYKNDGITVSLNTFINNGSYTKITVSSNKESIPSTDCCWPWCNT